MKKLFLLFVFLQFASCGVTKNATYIKDFKSEFKLQAYCHCITEGYGKKTSSSMTLKDKSFYSPVVSSIFFDELKKIGYEENRIMKLDSLHSIQVVSEATAGKKIISHCLQFYHSKKLDSLTNINYKKWKNIKNIDSIIVSKNPAY
ncbi:MAG: hypothetical protein ACRDEC_12285 [Flavobacterium sp.]